MIWSLYMNQGLLEIQLMFARVNTWSLLVHFHLEFRNHSMFFLDSETSFSRYSRTFWDCGRLKVRRPRICVVNQLIGVTTCYVFISAKQPCFTQFTAMLYCGIVAGCWNQGKSISLRNQANVTPLDVRRLLLPACMRWRLTNPASTDLFSSCLSAEVAFKTSFSIGCFLVANVMTSRELTVLLFLD